VFELANVAYFNLVGERDILGKSVAEALPEVREQGFIALLDAVFRTGRRHVGSAVPVYLQREAGQPELRFVDFIYQPLLDAAGATSGIFVEGHDVTDRKQAEDALRSADRRKDEFLATLAHELRNPLAPIRHAARISKTPGVTDAQLKWSHDVIDRQVDHMARLLDDLLEVSRITRGTLELRKEVIDLGESLVAAVETARPLIEGRGHDLVVVPPDGPVLIDADPVRFAQILSNLLTNAAKYTDQGGRITVMAKEHEGSAIISVADNGIGIAPELLSQVFEMFSQATSALDRSEGGLGIGLSLTRGLVALHGGAIVARSEGFGRGSEFVVTLPTAGLARFHGTGGEAAQTPGEASTQRPVRILVADDNRDSADSCAALLEVEGHDVRVAYNGAEALQHAQEFAPHLALLDIGMPVMNGYEVARRIRASSVGKTIMLVAVTGWGQDEDKRLAKEAGFDAHCVKPLDLDALAEMIARCAARSG
jgi:signal transduction histidine kinase/CheY-like chemotaxis protein